MLYLCVLLVVYRALVFIIRISFFLSCSVFSFISWMVLALFYFRFHFHIITTIMLEKKKKYRRSITETKKNRQYYFTIPKYTHLVWNGKPTHAVRCKTLKIGKWIKPSRWEIETKITQIIKTDRSWKKDRERNE